MNRGQLPPPCCRPPTGSGPKRLSGRTLICRNPHHIMYPAGSHSAPRTEVSLGARGHTPSLQRAHAPPTPRHDPHPIDDHQALDNPGRHKEAGRTGSRTEPAGVHKQRTWMCVSVRTSHAVVTVVAALRLREPRRLGDSFALRCGTAWSGRETVGIVPGQQQRGCRCGSLLRRTSGGLVGLGVS